MLTAQCDICKCKSLDTCKCPWHMFFVFDMSQHLTRSSVDNKEGRKLLRIHIVVTFSLCVHSFSGSTRSCDIHLFSSKEILWHVNAHLKSTIIVELCRCANFLPTICLSTNTVVCSMHHNQQQPYCRSVEEVHVEHVLHDSFIRQRETIILCLHISFPYIDLMAMSNDEVGIFLPSRHSS